MRTLTRSVPLLVAAILSSVAFAQKAEQKADQKGAAKPPTVSRAILKPLMAAQEASKKEQWPECVAKIKEVEAFPNRTPYDNYVSNDILGFCALRAGDTPLALQAWSQVTDTEFSDPARSATLRKGLLQMSYQLKDYAKAVDYGRRLIADGSTDESVHLLTIQSYYLQNDFKAAEKMAADYVAATESRAQTPPDMALQLYTSSCIKQEDDACTIRALEKQAQYSPKKETWPNLSLLLFRSSTEANTLNIFRLSREMGGMTRGEEFTEMAQLAIEKGLPGEAQATLEEGQSKGLYTNKSTQELATRLLGTAKAQAAADKPTLLKQDGEAAGKKNGEVDVRIATAFMSYGDYDKAVAAFERGLAKGNARNPEEAKLNLGISQIKAGKKEAAAATLASVQGDETLKRLARLWTQRTR
ncbi:MAG: tetratricopeptide repeat protein [Gammaproteobacteria bacterium]|jgi:Tfp pilus assembly protein PilF